MLPTISLVNLGAANKNKVRIGNLTLYFSYQTVVGFNHGYDFFVSENVWSKTTGNFLNELMPDKSTRIPNEEFQKKLNSALEKYNLAI